MSWWMMLIVKESQIFIYGSPLHHVATSITLNYAVYGPMAPVMPQFYHRGECDLEASSRWMELRL